MKISVKCPYCKNKNRISIERLPDMCDRIVIAVNCDTEQGGCDCDFVVRAGIVTETLKIEAEES